MSKIFVEHSAIIDAPAGAVHAVLRDYKVHHANILPRKYFTAYAVESGGLGEGTVFTATVTVFGNQMHYRMRVSESQPGIMIAERDLVNDTETQFKLEPVNGGAHTRVTIASSWTPKPGLAGVLERWFTPATMRKIYTAELEQLNAYMKAMPPAA